MNELIQKSTFYGQRNSLNLTACGISKWLSGCNRNWSSLMQRVRFREIHHQGGLWVTEAIEKQCLLTDLIKEAKHVPSRSS